MEEYKWSVPTIIFISMFLILLLGISFKMFNEDLRQMIHQDANGIVNNIMTNPKK